MTMQPHSTGTGTVVPELDRLKGMDVYDLNDDKIGTVKGVYVDGDDGSPGQVRYLAVESGWFGTKRHIIPFDDVQMTDRGDGLVVPYGRDHLETAPTYDDRDELPTHEEDRIYSHYGRSGYWEAVHDKQTTPAPTPEIARAEAVGDLGRGTSRAADRDRLTVAEHQETPSATPEIAEADIADRMSRGETPHRTAADDSRSGRIERRSVRRHDW